MNQEPKVSPFTAVAMLTMFKQRRLNMDERMFDQCVDALVELLEATNDEKFRLERLPGPITLES